MSTTIVTTKILFLSTYPPKKCGIASFTNDLINAINQEISGETAISICALEKKLNRELYEDKVCLFMDSFQLIPAWKLPCNQQRSADKTHLH